VKFKETPISGLNILESDLKNDHRGGFSRFFCERELSACLGSRKIVQINHSRTSKIGAVRGMHFQHPPYAEFKLVRCLRGRVWDVAVDIRHGSPTFLQWHAEILCPQNNQMLIIPEGFAHGFQALEANSELLYLHTNFYTPNAESGLLHDDPILGIEWPKPFTDLSTRDKNHLPLNPEFSGIKI